MDLRRLYIYICVCVCVWFWNVIFHWSWWWWWWLAQLNGFFSTSYCHPYWYYINGNNITHNNKTLWWEFEQKHKQKQETDPNILNKNIFTPLHHSIYLKLWIRIYISFSHNKNQSKVILIEWKQKKTPLTKFYSFSVFLMCIKFFSLLFQVFFLISDFSFCNYYLLLSFWLLIACFTLFCFVFHF